MSIADLNHTGIAEEFGGKASNLSILKKATIPVPPGFAIGNSTYQALRLMNDLSSIEEEIKKNLSKLTSPKVMVRSSAIGEDGQDNSFAGMLESFQVVNNLDEIISHIKKCWSSFSNQRAQTYQLSQKKTLEGMGVIIQEMIDPDFAGVFFTRNPNGTDTMYLEYVQGHAEKLVSGQVTPTGVTITKDGLSDRETPFPIKSLLKIVKKILKIYKQNPQDIEWVFKNNEFSIVQSRPITSVRTAQKWSNSNLNENFPEKISPLLYSLSKQSYYHYYKNLAVDLDLLEDTDGHHESSFANAVGLWNHKLYYNMTALEKIIKLSPLSHFMQTSFNDFIGDGVKPKKASKLDKLKLVKFSLKVIKHFLKLENNVKSIERHVDAFSESAKDASTLQMQQNSFQYFLWIRFILWRKGAFADFFSMITHGILGYLIKLITPTNYLKYQNGLIQSIPNLISHQPVLELYSLSEYIKNDPSSSELFKSPTDEIELELKK